MLRTITNATTRRVRTKGGFWRYLEKLSFACGHFRTWWGAAPREGGKAHCITCEDGLANHKEN